MGATKLPDRDEYPEKSAENFADAVKAALDSDEDSKFTHHRCGRYTAHQTHLDASPGQLNGGMELCVVVTECERETIAVLPVDYAEQMLALLKPFDSHVEEVASDLRYFASKNEEGGSGEAGAVQRDAASHVEDKLLRGSNGSTHAEKQSGPVSEDGGENAGHGYELGSVKEAERDD